MPEERRGRQNLVLVTGTRITHSSEKNEHKERNAIGAELPNRWARIGSKAEDKSTVFNNLHTHIDVYSLREAFRAIDGTKAVGADGISKSEYGKDLEANLTKLAERVKRGTYRPKPKREILIPKANGRTRPIAIACFEDKLVDWVVAKILTTVYEPLFIRNSFGYRPGKSAHGAIEACYYTLCKNIRQHVVEIDFSSFFNTIPHKKLMRVISKKISDRRFKGLIGRFLKGGLINKQQEILPSVLGTPQGSISSPVLANIYLHEVVDKWFRKNYASYNNVMVRYADDAVFFFAREEDAREFLKALGERVKQFELTLNEEKTRTLQLTKTNHQHFHFLGFTFYWGIQGSRTMLKVKTQKEKLLRSMREFEQWIKGSRNRMKLKELWAVAKAKIQGHINYYGYGTNSLKIRHFYWEATKVLFKWLNRRSQRPSYNWEGFNERLKHFPLMKPVERMELRQLKRNHWA